MSSHKQRIARIIHDAVPGLHAIGDVLAATPRGRIVRGFYIERSSAPASFYIWTFVQPLYVPASDVVLNLGDRLRHGGGPLWDSKALADLDDAARVGATFFEGLQSPLALSEWVRLADAPDDYGRQAKAFSLVLCGQTARALTQLHELATLGDDAIDWRRDIGERCARLAALLESSPQAAIDLLDTWELQTMAALRIDGVQ